MKTVFEIVIALLVVSSNSFAQDWFPLQKSNKWVYRWSDSSIGPGPHEGYYVRDIVSDTVMSNGKKYWIFTDGFYAGLGNLIRLDSLHTFYYRTTDSSEDTLFCFDTTKTSCRSFDPTKSPSSIQIRNSYWAVLFGVQTKILRIAVDGLILRYYSFSDRFGLIAEEQPNQSLGTGDYLADITGCVINDTTYGNLSSVEKIQSDIPANIQLLPNYPNPFNAETNVQFSVDSRTEVSLAVYDLLGRRVALLHEGVLEPGVYRTRWKPEAANTGLYLLRLQTPNNSFQQKILYLK